MRVPVIVRAVEAGMHLLLDSKNKNIPEDPAEITMMIRNTMEDGESCPMSGKESGPRCSCQKTWVCRGDSLISR
jgi:hypothetical protein